MVMGGGGGGRGEGITNTLHYLSPREIRLSGVHERNLVVGHDVVGGDAFLHGPLLLEQVPQGFVAFLVL
jgi:hypothetical protein